MSVPSAVIQLPETTVAAGSAAAGKDKPSSAVPPIPPAPQVGPGPGPGHDLAAHGASGVSVPGPHPKPARPPGGADSISSSPVNISPVGGTPAGSKPPSPHQTPFSIKPLDKLPDAELSKIPVDVLSIFHEDEVSASNPNSKPGSRRTSPREGWVRLTPAGPGSEQAVSKAMDKEKDLKQVAEGTHATVSASASAPAPAAAMPGPPPKVSVVIGSSGKSTSEPSTPHSGIGTGSGDSSPPTLDSNSALSTHHLPSVTSTPAEAVMSGVSGAGAGAGPGARVAVIFSEGQPHSLEPGAAPKDKAPLSNLPSASPQPGVPSVILPPSSEPIRAVSGKSSGEGSPEFVSVNHADADVARRGSTASFSLEGSLRISDQKRKSEEIEELVNRALREKLKEAGLEADGKLRIEELVTTAVKVAFAKLQPAFEEQQQKIRVLEQNQANLMEELRKVKETLAETQTQFKASQRAFEDAGHELKKKDERLHRQAEDLHKQAMDLKAAAESQNFHQDLQLKFKKLNYDFDSLMTDHRNLKIEHANAIICVRQEAHSAGHAAGQAAQRRAENFCR